MQRIAKIGRADAAVDLEIIVVENGSVDGTRERLPERYPEVRILQNEQNVGHGPGVNQGLKAARGEYAMLLDSDAQLDKAATRTMLTATCASILGARVTP